MARHKVKSGECLSSIAHMYGFSWDTIWSYSENSSLRNKRDPNVLFPGDVVHIPERQTKKEAGATENRHTFRLKGEPVELRLRLLKNNEPLADAEYILNAEGSVNTGKTDSDGNIRHRISPDAIDGTLELPDSGKKFILKIGDLDPVTENTGVQGRLKNLGFDCGPVDGIIGPRTRQALKSFQEAYDLEVTGDADDDTRADLEEMHGC